MSIFEDSRWLQRFQNFQRALMHLDDAIKTTENKDIEEFSDLEIQGTIKCFEMVFDLAWKTIQDYLEEQGYQLKGINNSIKQAFKDNLIKDGDGWAKMLESRNKAAHTYDSDMANDILQKVLTKYYALFDDLDKVLTKIKNYG